MELTAKIAQILPVQTGAGKNGPWKKQDIIVETEGQYPKKICISVWGDKVDQNLLQVGRQITVSFDIESREYNGRWYTDVKAWKVEAAANASSRAPGVQEPVNVNMAKDEEDLPF